MSLLEEISSAWGWVGVEPIEIVGENDFGNLIIRDFEEKYWRLCPEDCYCKIIANNRQELEVLSSNPEFLQDWHMSPLVNLAKEILGPLTEGRKYCLKIPAVIGGEYAASNLATAPLSALIGFSGYIAQQIHELPDGTPIKLEIVG